MRRRVVFLCTGSWMTRSFCLTFLPSGAVIQNTAALSLASSLLGCLVFIRTLNVRGHRRNRLSKAMAASGGVTTYESSTTTTSKSWISSSSASSVSKAKRPNEGRKFVQKPSSLSVPSTFRQKVDRVFGKFKCLVPIVPFKQEGKFSRRPAARNIFLAK